MQLTAYHENSVFEALKPEWNELLHRSASDCIFSTWEWQSTWWDAYHSGLLWVITCHDDSGHLIGIAPWFVQTNEEQERVVRSIGCVDVTDYVDVIADPEHFDAVLDAFAAHLVEQRALYDRINLCNIPEQSPTCQRFPDILRQHGLEAELVFQEVCPVIELPDDWEQYLEALDKKQRHEIRRKLRRAESEAKVEWYIVGPDHDLLHELECFLSLMASSHPEKAKFLRNPQNLDFFRKIAPITYEKGWLQLAFLVVNGETTAAYMNFDYNERILVYNSGLLPENNPQLSAGNVLLAYMIQHAITTHRKVYDFLRGNEVYKYRMGAKDTQVFKLKAQLAQLTAMVNLQWDEVYNLSVTSVPESSSIQIGQQQFNSDASLDFGPPLGAVPAMRLPQALARYLKMSAGTARPQLALLVFAITRQPFALNTYFPLTKNLDTAGLHQFHQLAQEIMLNRNFDLRLLGYDNQNRAGEFPEVAYFAAGHLAEIFFFRRDIVERLLSAPRHFWLYTTTQDFKKAGGIGGGCFDPRTGALQLVVSRLFEGFNGKTPGAAPFIHEFGHMLDYFNARTGAVGSSEGFMPGLRQTDDDLYTPEARELFLKGKKLELERYMQFYEGTHQPGDLLPIGHPYVFQTNSEFIAGYLEMFFRNPHYFAAQNPDLYQGFSLLFRQDPRQVWKEDFPYYIEQNRGFYLSGKKPGKPGVTV